MSSTFLIAAATRHADSRAPGSSTLAAPLVFASADVLPLILSNADSCKTLCCAAQINQLCHTSAMHDRMWRAVLHRSTQTDGHALPVSTAWWRRPCVQRVLRGGWVCRHCQSIVCTMCWPHPSRSEDRTRVLSCGDRELCEICEEVAIGLHSPLQCSPCLEQCRLCQALVCPAHIHRDGRCVTCVEDEWSAYGAFTWNR